MNILQFQITESEYNSYKERILELLRECECCAEKAPIFEIENMLDKLYNRLKICYLALKMACDYKYCEEYNSDCEKKPCNTFCTKNKIQRFLHDAEMDILEKK